MSRVLLARVRFSIRMSAIDGRTLGAGRLGGLGADVWPNYRTWIADETLRTPKTIPAILGGQGCCGLDRPHISSALPGLAATGDVDSGAPGATPARQAARLLAHPLHYCPPLRPFFRVHARVQGPSDGKRVIRSVFVRATRFYGLTRPLITLIPVLDHP